MSDAISEAAINAQIKVGQLYFSSSDTDPAATLGYGTWQAYAAGRAIVGVGNNGESDWTPALERGSETHQITADEVPAHSHTVNPPVVNASVDPTTDMNADVNGHFMANNYGSSNPARINPVFEQKDLDIVGADISQVTLQHDFNHGHDVSVDIPEFESAAVGGDQPHNNVQPSIAVYVWLRTA